MGQGLGLVKSKPAAIELDLPLRYGKTKPKFFNALLLTTIFILTTAPAFCVGAMSLNMTGASPL